MRRIFEEAQASDIPVTTTYENASAKAVDADPAIESDGDQEQSISEVAEAFGVTMRTLRFYESKGLLSPRRLGNRRFYDEASRARLRLVLKGKAMGFGLDEIDELVSVVESGLSDTDRASELRRLCEAQRGVLNGRRDVIDAQIEETNRVLDGLITL